jgi:hypothetical protein
MRLCHYVIGGAGMKKHSKKRKSGKRKAKSQKVEQEAQEFDYEAMLASLPKSDPTPYLIKGEDWLKVMDTFNFPPDIWDEWKKQDAEIRKMYRKMSRK